MCCQKKWQIKLFFGYQGILKINYLENARNELQEETGLGIEDINRFEYISNGQMVSNLNTYKASLYKIKLNKSEYLFLKERENKKNGNLEDSEITYVTFINEKDLYKYNIDFAHLGLISRGMVN